MSMSLTTAEIETFMIDVSTTSTNMAIASSSASLRLNGSARAPEFGKFIGGRLFGSRSVGSFVGRTCRLLRLRKSASANSPTGPACAAAQARAVSGCGRRLHRCLPRPAGPGSVFGLGLGLGLGLGFGFGFGFGLGLGLEPDGEAERLGEVAGCRHDPGVPTMGATAMRIPWTSSSVMPTSVALHRR